VLEDGNGVKDGA